MLACFGCPSSVGCPTRIWQHQGSAALGGLQIIKASNTSRCCSHRCGSNHTILMQRLAVSLCRQIPLEAAHPTWTICTHSWDLGEVSPNQAPAALGTASRLQSPLGRGKWGTNGERTAGNCRANLAMFALQRTQAPHQDNQKRTCRQFASELE